MNSIIKDKKSFYLLGVLFIFVIWIILHARFENDYIVPSVDLTFKALFNLFGQKQTYLVLGYTLIRLLISVGVCLVLGVILAVFSNLNYRIKAFFKPTIVLLKTLPIAVVIILLLIMFTREYAPFYIVSVVVFPLIYEATLTGLENIDPNIKDEVKMLSSNNSMVVKKIYLPLTLPYIITSLIQSFGLGLKVLVMAEYISQPAYSIGNELVYYKDIAIEMEYVYAWSLILIVFVLFVEFLIAYVTKKKALV